jgi:hypothetical protein
LRGRNWNFEEGERIISLKDFFEKTNGKSVVGVSNGKSEEKYTAKSK